MQNHFEVQLWLAKMLENNVLRIKLKYIGYITLLVEFPASAMCLNRQTKIPPLSVIKREYKKAWCRYRCLISPCIPYIIGINY